MNKYLVKNEYFPKPWGSELFITPNKNLAGDDLTYLGKIIETHEELSVQVHPTAESIASGLGKTECWLILETKSDRAGLYLGFKKGTTKNLLKERLEKNESILEYLNFYTVSAGDFFYVPAGTVHAIGRDIKLIEVQENCGITYRVWDWMRNNRELHIKEALSVLNFNEAENTLAHFQYKKHNLSSKDRILLASHPHFHFELMTVEAGQQIINLPSAMSACTIVSLGAEGAFLEEQLRPYSSFIWHKNNWEVNITTAGKLAIIY